MRRGLGQKGQDICFFCALRWGIDSSRSIKPPTGLRYLHSNVPLRRPGAAQAVLKEEQDDSDVRSFQSPPPQPPRVLRGFDAFAEVTTGPSDNTKRKGKASPTITRAPAPARRQQTATPSQQDPWAPRRQDPFSAPVQEHPTSSVFRRVQSTSPEIITRKTQVGSLTAQEPAPFAGPRKGFAGPGVNGSRDTRVPFAERPQGGYTEYRPPFSGQRPIDSRETRRPFGGPRQSQSRDARGPYAEQGRFPQNGRGQQDFAEEVFASFNPSVRRPRDTATGVPASVEEDTRFRDDNDPTRFIGHHRRGQKQPESREDRRSRRLASEEDDDDTNSIRGKKKQTWVSNRKDAYEQQMEELEAQMEGRTLKKKKVVKPRPVQSSRPRVEIPTYMSVQNLSRALDVRPPAFMRRLVEEGYENILHDHVFDASTAATIAEMYGFDSVMLGDQQYTDLVARPPAPDPSILPSRPPVVTIMGHVDHGKTTILDYLRKSSVVETEHGGITQHIGAFSVLMPVTNRKITFLDTPGHAAFLDMRRRGAVVTDIVVLVVAADDSVKPQTIEAIKHATDAKVQIIVAINKVDKEDANVQKVWQDLAREGINVEEYGGDIQAIPLSGKTGKGMDALEEAIVTQADVSDFRAEADGAAEGWIIETKVTSGGRVATVLVRRGTLRLGDYIVAGTTWARVRTLRNDAGQMVTEAPPGTPVQVDGWRGEDPTAGLEVLQAEDEHRAKQVVDYRIQQAENLRAATDMVVINKAKSEETEAHDKVREWRREQGFVGKKVRRRPKDNAGWVEPTTDSGPKRIPFVVKADVAGSAEAIEAAVGAFANAELIADVIHFGTGQISESDIKLLATTGKTGFAISFNQPIDATMYRLAEAANLQILDHNIIYKVTDEVKAKLEDELAPIVTQRVHGEAEIGQIFDITVKKAKIKIAGCKVTNGTISKARQVRVLRNQKVIYTGTLDSLKNIKKDVTEMRKGGECGMSFDGWSDFQEGDQIQCMEETSEKKKWY